MFVEASSKQLAAQLLPPGEQALILHPTWASFRDWYHGAIKCERPRLIVPNISFYRRKFDIWVEMNKEPKGLITHKKKQCKCMVG